MNSVQGDLALTEICDISAFDIVTGAYLFTLDELQNVSIEQTQEKTDITGKQGRKLSSLKKNKAVIISGANGLISSGLLEMQTGGDIENKTTTVMWSESLAVNSDKATTSFKAVGTVGNEIEVVYIKNTDNTLGKKLTQDATAATDKFAYDPTTKEITFNAGDITDGTEIFVNYCRKIQANVLDNMSDKYSKKCHLYINLMAEDKCGNIFRTQIDVPKGDFDGECTLEIGDNQTVHNFKVEALAGAGCGIGGDTGKLWTATVFGANAEDAA